MRADATINIRVVVKGLLRCLSFGRRIFIWVSVWLATYISMLLVGIYWRYCYVLMHDSCPVIVCACFCEVLQCFMTRDHWVWYLDVCGRLSFKTDVYVFFDVFV